MSKILVIGDCIIDEYIYASVERISPEAPVPIAKIESRDFSPGGAANVACSLAQLDNEVAFMSVFSSIDNELLFDMLNSYGINYIFQINAILKNITKTRIISNGHHLLRLDEENNIYSSNEEIEKQLNNCFSKIINFNPELIVISDYNKYIIDLLYKFKFKKLNYKIIADIKPINFEKLIEIFGKIHAILPNEKEILNSIKCNNYIESANYWLGKIAENIIVTRSQHGVSLFQKDKQEIKIPSEAIEVNDVTGCGDTVTAIYAHMLCQKYSDTEALNIANKCAGITATKIGTHKITRAELHSLL